MKNVIAVIWDCDKTLIDGYMQDPMFAEYGVETKQFWADENKILDEYQKTGVRVNRDTYYLNYFILLFFIRRATGDIQLFSPTSMI